MESAKSFVIMAGRVGLADLWPIAVRDSLEAAKEFVRAFVDANGDTGEHGKRAKPKRTRADLFWSQREVAYWTMTPNECVDALAWSAGNDYGDWHGHVAVFEERAS
jgi:hypothetical protein